MRLKHKSPFCEDTLYIRQSYCADAPTEKMNEVLSNADCLICIKLLV